MYCYVEYRKANRAWAHSKPEQKETLARVTSLFRCQTFCCAKMYSEFQKSKQTQNFQVRSKKTLRPCIGIGLADHMLFYRCGFLMSRLVLGAQELLGRKKRIRVPYKRPLAPLKI